MESDLVRPGQLLDELKNSYQALTFKERKQVIAFLSEFSYMGMNTFGELREVRTAGTLFEK